MIIEKEAINKDNAIVLPDNSYFMDVNWIRKLRKELSRTKLAGYQHWTISPLTAPMKMEQENTDFFRLIAGPISDLLFGEIFQLSRTEVITVGDQLSQRLCDR